MEATPVTSVTISADYEVIDTRHGLMLCNRHDVGAAAILRANGAWSWEEIQSLVPYYGGVMVDVGANVGTHTLEYAKHASHVYAFEPQLQVYHTLCANLLLNHVANVSATKCALSGVNGHMTIRGYDPRQENCPAGASLGLGEEKVPVRTLDSLQIPHVDFIKIDVEGHEFYVLQGAAATLKRDHPTVYVEIHSPTLIDQIIPFMERIGYTSQLWCHIDIAGPDYPGKVPFTEGYLFTWQ